MEFKNLDLLKDKWTFNEEYDCWCLEEIFFTENILVEQAQRLNIYVPAEYMSENGQINADGEKNGYTAATAPVIFQNNSGGYREMPCVGLGHERCFAKRYLSMGYVFVSCGNRGSESVDKNGNSCGKAPANLVDLKVAIRFLRHNKAELPGDLDKIVSIGSSAGGAMSSLLAVTGNNPRFDEYLIESKAYMDESDAIFAAQIYCPIVDLEHADIAYEWCFSADSENEDSHAGPAGVMTPFQRALSNNLRKQYVDYFNSLNLTSVEKKIPLYIEEDGRSGTGYDYLINKLNESAAVYLTKLANGELPVNYSVEDYILGDYTYQVMKRTRPDQTVSADAQAVHKPTMVDVPGEDKSLWLSWDGEHAMIPDIDTYVLAHRRRMKPCTSFDILSNESGENKVFGNGENDFVHFSENIARALEELKDQYPEECNKLLEAYNRDCASEDVKKKLYLFNPMNYIGTDEKSDQPKHYRINVGARDADTSFTISMALACKLAQQYDDVSYNIIWEMPHCEADYEGDVVKWIEKIAKE